MTFKVLLTGVDWFGDLIAFCERGLRELGAEVRTVPTNRTDWLAGARHLGQQLARLPLVGAGISWRWERRLWRRVESEVNQAVARAVKEWRPDLFLSLLCWGDPLQAETLDAVKGVRKVGWLMDDPFQHDGRLIELLHCFDHLYVVDESWATPIRLATGGPVTLLPCGADCHSHYPLPSQEVPPELHCGITFVGTSYRTQAAGVIRQRLLEAIADLDLHIHGDQGWFEMTGPGTQLARCFRGRELDTRQVNRAYNGADIVVNIHHPQFRCGTSLRTFAVCASGAFQLVDWRPGIERFLVPDHEVVTYRTPHELREKAIHYLADEEARRRIARAGYERVRREHTYAHRLRRILREAGLGAAALPSGSPAFCSG